MNYKLILLVITIFLLPGVQVRASKSPHGDKLKTECKVCHIIDSWSKIKPNGFNHNKTNFPLKGQHSAVNCKKCHATLVFEDKTPKECVSCHTDIHEGTVGKDCKSCHTPNAWIVNNIRQIHERAGFPFLGEHGAADCIRCHTSASLLRFNNIRTDCYSCHQYEYQKTISPNHATSGLGIDCQRCHNMAGQSWRSVGNGFDHSVLPLVGGHKVQCDFCHINNNYTVKLSTVCSSCHDPGPANTSTPAHTTRFKAFACSDCHNTTTWASVKFPIHDGLYGGIYSGRHNGRWTACTDCHQNTTLYTSYCSKCHDFNSGSLNGGN